MGSTLRKCCIFREQGLAATVFLSSDRAGTSEYQRTSVPKEPRERYQNARMKKEVKREESLRYPEYSAWYE